MSQSKRNMKVLRARTRGLEGFVDSGKATGTLLTHRLRELDAMRWALVELEKARPELGEEQ